MYTVLDFLLIGTYILGAFVLAVAVSRGKGKDSWFVNTRSTKLLLLILSIVSTTIGAGFFLTVAAEAYDTGISFGISIMIVVAVTALVLAWIAPAVKRLSDDHKTYTVPELMRVRYGDAQVGLMSGAVIILGYIFVTALQFVGIGAAVALVAGVEFSWILLGAGVTTIAYTAIGGIRGTIYADAVSFVVIAVALLVLVPMVLLSEGSAIQELPSRFFDPFAFAGPSFLVLSILISVVSAFIFLELWQRIFAAETVATARRAFAWSAVVQPLLVAAACVLGLGAAARYPDANKTDALFLVVRDFLPPGLTGLGTVALVAVLMSTVNSLILVGGSTIYVDMLRRREAEVSSDDGDLKAVRSIAAGFGTVAVAVAYLVPDLVRLLLMGAFIMLPLCPTIIYGVFASRPTARAAKWSIGSGMLVTLGLLPLMPETAFGPGFLVSLTVMASMHRAATSPFDQEDRS